MVYGLGHDFGYTLKECAPIKSLPHGTTLLGLALALAASRRWSRREVSVVFIVVMTLQRYFVSTWLLASICVRRSS